MNSTGCASRKATSSAWKICEGSVTGCCYQLSAFSARAAPLLFGQAATPAKF